MTFLKSCTWNSEVSRLWLKKNLILHINAFYNKEYDWSRQKNEFDWCYVETDFFEFQFLKERKMISTCFPGALNPFCRQTICISSCSDQIALATSSSLLYIYSYTNQNLLFIKKFSPHSKSLSCMIFHPTIPGLLVTGGAPNSRIILWSIKDKTVEKQTTFNLQRVSKKFFFFWGR